MQKTLYLAYASLGKNIDLNFTYETRCKTHGLTNETSRQETKASFANETICNTYFYFEQKFTKNKK